MKFDLLKPKPIHYYLQTTLLIAGLSTFSHFASAGINPLLESERDFYLEVFSGNDTYRQMAAAKRLELPGDRMPEIFDALRALLKEQSAHPESYTYTEDDLAWLLKVLAYSGDSRFNDYFITVEKQASSRKLKRYANNARTEILPKYQVLNQSVSIDNVKADVGFEAARYIGALKSKDLNVVLMAAQQASKNKVIIHPVSEAISTRLLSMLGQEKQSKLHLNVMKWLSRALATTGDLNFKPTLDTVTTNSSRALSRYASKHIKVMKTNAERNALIKSQEKVRDYSGNQADSALLKLSVLRLAKRQLGFSAEAQVEVYSGCLDTQSVQNAPLATFKLSDNIKVGPVRNIRVPTTAPLFITIDSGNNEGCRFDASFTPQKNGNYEVDFSEVSRGFGYVTCMLRTFKRNNSNSYRLEFAPAFKVSEPKFSDIFLSKDNWRKCATK